MDYPHLWGRLYGAPLAIDPEKASIIEAVFRSRMLDLPAPADVQAAAARILARPPIENAAQVKFRARGDKPYAITESGIAVIPVLGTLVQRASGLDALSGMMSYGSIGSRVQAAAQDGEVRAILLEVDSMGGEAYGLAELADQIVAARDAKPLWAAINEQAYSAAYFIASSAAKVTIPVSGGTGSIGVIALHVDQSKRDANQGYAYTYVYAGARKKDFNSHEPLSDAAREVLQGEVDRHYGLFAAHVAKARGIKEAAVRATEAGLLSPQAAKAGGFVDEIATFAETVGLIEAALRDPNALRTTGSLAAGRSSTSKEISMDKDAPAAGTLTAEQQEQVRLQVETKLADAIKAHSARITTILGLEEAKGRGKLAAHLANNTAMSVDDAKALLAVSALEAPTDTKTPLAKAMGGLKNPDVGADATDDVRAAASTPSIDTAAIYAMWNKPQGAAQTH
jgi:ClpP class serine protease